MLGSQRSAGEAGKPKAMLPPPKRALRVIKTALIRPFGVNTTSRTAVSPPGLEPGVVGDDRADGELLRRFSRLLVLRENVEF